MTSLLSTAGAEFLRDTQSITLAHTVSLQLPGGSTSFVHFTDFRRDLTVGAITYQSGVVKSVGNTRQTRDLSNYNINITVSGIIDTELQRVLDSTAYIGRQITVRRFYLDQDENIIQMTDTSPSIIFFEGEIVSMGVRDVTRLAGTGSSTITWACSSRLNNFNRVNGRVTDDASHRGLVSVNGDMVPSGSAKKLEYQTDKGFFHANRSVDVLATYQAQERRYKLVSKRSGGLGGLLGVKKYKSVEYWETVTREQRLDIDLAAKYIPIVYGTQRTAAIPVFVDTDASNADDVWAVYAVCEGEIEGFLDFYIEDQPLICAGNGDTDNRVCLGNKRVSGDTISTQTGGSTAVTQHGEKYSINDGNGDIDIWVYHGTTAQSANPEMVAIAAANNFLIQRTTNAGTEYWDSTFRLADTAYIVVRTVINENRRNLPSIECEVVGKKVNTYNSTGVLETSNATSLNFVWQTLDYLTSPIYGAGLPMEVLPLDSILESASFLDIQDTSYQSAWVPYWRYLGWTAQDNSNRQIVQGSAFFDTSVEVFKNLQGILLQYDASLNVFNGTYRLTVEALREPVASIHINNLKEGTFGLDDTTSRDKFNSLQASISDPASSWNTIPVTFFNRQFLEDDGNIENKGNVPFPFINNYYTARSRAERLLNRSRLTRRITGTLPFRFVELFPRSTVTFTYPRYGWDNKEFQIEDLTNLPSGDVQFTMVEYDRGTFINSGQSDNSGDQNSVIVVDVLPPTNLVYTPEITLGTVAGLQGTLSWTASRTAEVAFYSVRRTGTLDVFTVQADGSVPLELPIRNLIPGSYTFEVRALNGLGRVSSPVSLTVNVDASVNLPLVPNFRANNILATNSMVFIGSTVELRWDAFDTLVPIPGLQYELQVLDTSRDILRAVTLTSVTRAFDYTLILNKADFAAASGTDELGVNRSLIFRIRATGSGGAQSVDWVEL